MKRIAVIVVVMLAWLLFGGAAGAQGEIVRAPAEQLAEAIAAAQPGDTIEVTGGVFHGNLVIDKPLTLIGLDGATLDAGGQGTVLRIEAPDTTVRGFVVRNTGDSLDREDSGIIAAGPRALVENNRLENVLFGIYINSAPGTIVRGNEIEGQDLDIARRGDLIRLWDSDDVLIEGNVTRRGRDAVLWYSERMTLRNNDFSYGRYGLHFMYCDDAVMEGNRLTYNSVGAYLMYGRRMTLRDNLLAFNRGPSGYGLGLKDMDDSVITGNRFLDNRVGAFVDGSPREMDSTGIFRGNLFAYNDIALEMLPSVRHNLISDNSFVENEQQVVVAGGGQLRDNEWTVGDRGNYWGDYAGYDDDGDGQGEIAYKSERLLDSLIGRQPELRLFVYSPVINAVDFAARAFPLVRPQPVLVDEKPLTQPVLPANAPLPLAANEGALWPALLLPLALLLLFGLGRVGQRQYKLEIKN
ncbi:nitrous oxide reductase family maturation protein NosD [Promineifilum sp.]|uniref:nitrous oxide reductase family maturation protein NosD n=1 Tax=Promineifilum sp. TaxID=2664178 RepID=UPI0035ADFC7D